MGDARDYFWSTFLEPYMKYLKTEDFTYRGRIKKNYLSGEWQCVYS